MKIVIAPDSFKGSMESTDVICIVSDAAQRILHDVEIVEIPIADGGEGTVDAVLYGGQGYKAFHKVTGPTGQTVEAAYAVIDDIAVMEMAACSGLPLVPEECRNPLHTTSRGTGELIRHILDQGLRKIIIGIGGSATNDGGMGAMQALGAHFINQNNDVLDAGCGAMLEQVERIDLSDFDQRVKECDITVMCDVTNPLVGQQGATYIYGPQKGADPSMVESLEQGMAHYAHCLSQTFGYDVSLQPGAGAAGGMGAALMAFGDAHLVRGIDMMLDIHRFKDIIADADLIITGEGRVDEQSAFGKVIHGVTQCANEVNVPVIVIAGGVGGGVQAVYDLGVQAIYALPNRPMNLTDTMVQAPALLEQLSCDLFRTLDMGSRMRR